LNFRGDNYPDRGGVFQVGMNFCVEKTTVSPVVKRYMKKHMKKVRNNKSLHESILEIYEKPAIPDNIKNVV